MSAEIPKTYEPQAIEPKWYSFWEDHGCFTADPGRVSEKRPAYSIVIPPPNVTGVLTLGHVLNNTIQDILARRARMLGKEVLWLPGTDHAGIATQNVVEKALKKEGAIKHRNDLGREGLVAKIWEWREKYGGIILKQLRALGASCDWSRTRFTMDEAYSQCVSRVFVDLYKKGLIYRGKRMVNWCPASMTALSDEEVTMKEQNGALYYFKVEVLERRSPSSSSSSSSSSSRPEGGTAGGGEKEKDEEKDEAPTWLPAGRFLTIATTRPETIPGDSGIAVNPKDPRYAGLIGKHARRPLPRENQAPLPIVGDDHVAFDFGTGVLKVTPAHDKADFEIGQRHSLEVIDIMHPNGIMNDLAGADLAGLERFAARKKAVEVLTELGALEKEEPYKNNVGYSERADVPIEPRLSEQWFLKYPSVEQAKACVANGEMRFFPDRWAKVYDHWMSGIQDWCISRQLWWGHRVPVWTKDYPDHLSSVGDSDQIDALTRNRKDAVVRQEPEIQLAEDSENPSRIYVCIAPDESADSNQQNLIKGIEALGFTQDPDVLDTWFSSWLWPFATMGWPDKTDTLAKFYPTTDLVTGPDIIFFWVARMIMAGYEWMGDLPFRNVYFTGIIRDKQGRKLSKSLGNSPDPLDLIAKYGADALRFGTMRSAPLGEDVTYDEKNVELGRNFCTKLWNAARFRQMQGGATEGEIVPSLLTADDRWIMMKLDAAIRDVSTALNEYRFSDATSALYRFFWSEFCDWYLEASKASLSSSSSSSSSSSRPEDGTDGGTNDEDEDEDEDEDDAATAARRANTLAVLDFVLANTLRLFHPFLPFITEELWQGMGFVSDLPADQGGTTIMTARWPTPFTDDERHYFDLDPSQVERAEERYAVVTAGRGLRRDYNIASNKRARFVLRTAADIPAHDRAVLTLLMGAEPFEVQAPAWAASAGTPSTLTPLGELFLPLEGLIDVAAEKVRLTKELAKVEQELAKVRAKLADADFAAKVPATVLDEHRQREAAWAEKHAHLEKMRAALG